MSYALCLAALALAFPRAAQAGGLYLQPFGTEPASRAGARVAGVSSPHALWYNPAGLAYAKRQALVDLGMPIARASFTRFNPDGTRSATAHAPATVLPIPTLAYSDNFGLERWGFGVGLIIPPAYSVNWPSSVDGQPAPQRYSILNTDGSAFGSLALGAAWRPLDRLAIGAALYLTAGQVGGEVAVSACDYAFCSQPEGREWEGRTRFQLGPVFSASAVFGARYDFAKIRVGGSVQVRSKLSGEAEFDVALPDSYFFDDVTLTNKRGGDDLRADMELKLPTIIRLGVEGDVERNTKLELDGTWENWGVQKSVTVTPLGVYARNVPGVGDVQAQPVTLARNLRPSWAIALGGTHDLHWLRKDDLRLHVNAGILYESSSLSTRDLSATTIDTNKVMLACGVSVEVAKGWLIDFTYGHMFMQNRTVRDSRVLLPAAIRPLPTDGDPSVYEAGDRPAIGNGKYAIEADFVAIGARWLIDDTHPRH
ncbi:MAG TPA: outer membrane protein transport protein [Polyangiales bacterium]|nr:outer membrane protein transport protein [Polyangiales bacterium]